MVKFLDLIHGFDRLVCSRFRRLIGVFLKYCGLHGVR